MAISNYGELQTAVGNWLNRADLSGFIPDLITLAAQRIYYGSTDPVLPSEPVRVWSMQTVATPAIASSVALPARYLSTIALMLDQGGGGITLEYVTPPQFARYLNNSCVPTKYTVLDNVIKLSGTGSGTLTHHYYQSFAAFSADSDTNALLTTSPGLWLYGALLESAIFTYDDENAKKWHRMYVSTVTGLNRNAMEHGGGTLAVRAS